MKPDILFLQRSEQINLLLDSHNEVDLLDLGGLIRQLLCDQYPLVQTVNVNKIPIEFEAGLFRQPPDAQTELLLLEDGLDPQTRPPGSPSTKFDHQGFLNHVVIHHKGKQHTVRDVIKFASNVAGGVHHDPHPRPEYRDLASASEEWGIAGLPLSIRQLKAIARVTMRGIDPLISDVKTRGGQ